MKTFVNILIWILAGFLAILFTFAGGMKLIGARAMVPEFSNIGLGQWFRYVTGLLEVGGAIGLLIPKHRVHAALLLAIVMAGATLINIAILRLPPMAVLTAVLMSLALLLTWLAHRSSTGACEARMR